jgi:hypothetical protein
MILLDQIRETKLIELAKSRFDTDLSEAELKVLRDSASSEDLPVPDEKAPRPGRFRLARFFDRKMLWWTCKLSHEQYNVRKSAPKRRFRMRIVTRLAMITAWAFVFGSLISGCKKAETAGKSNATAVGQASTRPAQKSILSEELAKGEQTDVTPSEASEHNVLYQAGIDVSVTEYGQTVKKRIAVYGVAGLRFPALPLVVDRRASLSDTVITIEDAKGRFLIPAKDSAVPVEMGFDAAGKSQVSFFTQAINVKWLFSKPGIRFVAGESVYETERSGAFVAFTADGVKIDGLKML